MPVSPMLQELLSAERITILVEPGDRATVLEAAARLLADPPPGHTGALATRTIGDSLRSREQLASTAIGHGVAIPHARISSIDESRGAFLRLTQPVDFAAADGERVDLVFALVVPEHYIQQHLQQLADLAAHFADPAFRADLRDAANVDQLRRRLLAGPSLHARG
ncbi:PTS sugar transporter subunit IIA [Lysobacter koreensis]|uniref:PTS sugar transporter subunit IIA n=1 Tax=Lysobacter koreensis TaxID=266122 RepID=A0ABW2YLX2_9GAMM